VIRCALTQSMIETTTKNHF